MLLTFFNTTPIVSFWMKQIVYAYDGLRVINLKYAFK